MVKVIGILIRKRKGRNAQGPLLFQLPHLKGKIYPVSKMFGVYDEATGLAIRGTFVINPEGTILNSEVNFYNLGRNIDELLRKLEANIYLSEHEDEACPAQWKEEGDKTLTPSPELVGKVYEALE
jgi:alkyl hydroperoxide reductase subunit AhpC